jgi:hypothetical protein
MIPNQGINTLYNEIKDMKDGEAEKNAGEEGGFHLETGEEEPE